MTPYIDFDVDLETKVLSACLTHDTAFSVVFSMTTEDCYHIGKSKQLFAILNEVYRDGMPTDSPTVWRRYYDKGILEVDGYKTQVYIGMLTKDAPLSTNNLEFWCIMLRELAAKRLLKQITTGGFKGDDVVQTVSDIENKLKQILEVKSTDDWVDNSQVAIRIIRHMEQVKDKSMPGITTSIPDVDAINGGFRDGQMIVLAARPAVGKSAFMGRLAVSVARSGKIVGIISLEMEAKDVMERMVASDSGVPFWKIDRAQFTDDAERKRVHDILSEQSVLPIYYSENVKVNIHDIRAKAEKLKREKGLDILLIDYLQLVNETGKQGRNREQAVAEISRGCKLLAMTLKIPVIVLAQLNREMMEGKGQKPQLHHLRESGSIEQDADIVMFLHRDFLAGKEFDESGNSTEGQADLLVRKWRNGAPMEVKLLFDKEQMRFYTEQERDVFTQFPVSNPRAGITGRVFTEPNNRVPDEDAPF